MMEYNKVPITTIAGIAEHTSNGTGRKVIEKPFFGECQARKALLTRFEI